MFDKGMKGKDYLCFISNLVNSLKLGRNTSNDPEEGIGYKKGVDSYSEKGNRGILLVMDNASIHHEKEVNRLL